MDAPTYIMLDYDIKNIQYSHQYLIVKGKIKNVIMYAIFLVTFM